MYTNNYKNAIIFDIIFNELKDKIMENNNL